MFSSVGKTCVWGAACPDQRTLRMGHRGRRTAWATRAEPQRKQTQFCRSFREKPHVHRSFMGWRWSNVGIRPKVFGPVLAHLAGREDSWESFVFDDNEGVRLVVFQLDVVERLVLLDQAVFEQQRIRLARGDNPVDGGDFAHEQPRFARLPLHEVTRHPLLQVLGLADVQDGAVFVEVFVDARFVRQTPKERGEVFRGRHR